MNAPEHCQDCGHSYHAGACLNMASDNDCDCRFRADLAPLPAVGVVGEVGEALAVLKDFRLWNFEIPSVASEFQVSLDIVATTLKAVMEERDGLRDALETIAKDAPTENKESDWSAENNYGNYDDCWSGGYNSAEYRLAEIARAALTKEPTDGK